MIAGMDTPIFWATLLLLPAQQIKENPNMILNNVSALIGMVTGCAGFVISLINIRKARADVVIAFLSEVGNRYAIKARKHVYSVQELELDDEMASYLVNFYHHWGIMVKRGYLPLWAFGEGTATGTIRLHKRLEPFICKMRKKQHDCSYAEGFDWLNKELTKLAKPNTKESSNTEDISMLDDFTRTLLQVSKNLPPDKKDTLLNMAQSLSGEAENKINR